MSVIVLNVTLWPHLYHLQGIQGHSYKVSLFRRPGTKLRRALSPHFHLEIQKCLLARTLSSYFISFDHLTAVWWWLGTVSRVACSQNKLGKLPFSGCNPRDRIFVILLVWGYGHNGAKVYTVAIGLPDHINIPNTPVPKSIPVSSLFSPWPPHPHSLIIWGLEPKTSADIVTYLVSSLRVP